MVQSADGGAVEGSTAASRGGGERATEPARADEPGLEPGGGRVRDASRLERSIFGVARSTSERLKLSQLAQEERWEKAKLAKSVVDVGDVA